MTYTSVLLEVQYLSVTRSTLHVKYTSANLSATFKYFRMYRQGLSTPQLCLSLFGIVNGLISIYRLQPCSPELSALRIQTVNSCSKYLPNEPSADALLTPVSTCPNINLHLFDHS